MLVLFLHLASGNVSGARFGQLTMVNSFPEYHADAINDGGYTSIVLGMDPVAYFPLNEASDNDPMLELRGQTGQSHVNSPVYQHPGHVISGDSSKGVEYNGVNEYGDLLTLGTFGSGGVTAFTCIFWYRASVTTTPGDMLGCSQSNNMAFRILINYQNVSGRINLFCRDTLGNRLQGTNDQPNINDGEFNLIHVEMITATSTINFRFNNAAQTISYLWQEAPSNFVDFTDSLMLGGARLNGTPSRFVNSAFSHLAFWNRVLTVRERQILKLGAV
tara:strand:+ start:222 stop:1043 length:822 start_codon:yes stop_codon:yes gene_type:complete